MDAPTTGLAGVDWNHALDLDAPDMAVVLDDCMRIVWRSASAARLTRLADGEATGTAPSTRIHPDDLPLVLAAVAHARDGAAERVCVPLEFRMQSTDGRHWLKASGWMSDLSTMAEGHLLVRCRVERHDADWDGAITRDPYLALTNHSSYGFALIGPHGNLGYRNPAFGAWFPADRVITVADLADCVRGTDRPVLATWAEEVMTGTDHGVTVAIDHADGSTTWLDLEAVARSDQRDGFAVGITAHDITDRLEAQASLRQVVDLVPHLIYVVDGDGQVRLANRATADFVGVPVDSLRGHHLGGLPGGAGLDDLVRSRGDLIASGEAVTDALDQVVDPEGRTRFLRTSLIPYRAAGSGTPALLGVSTDVTREVTSEGRLAAMGRNMPDLAVIVSTDGRRTFVSDSIEDLLGWTPLEWATLDDDATVHPDDLTLAHQAFDTNRTEPGSRSRVELRFCARNGSWRWFEVGTVNLGDDPAIGGMLLFGRDISERKEHDRRLRFEATHDPLSNLLNRSAVIEELEAALAEARQDGSSVGALFCDLDNFKMVNDGLGHEVGDHLLQRISRRMQDAVRETDVVGRLGGDEFLVVARSVGSEDQLVRLADRVATTVAADLKGTPFPVSLSIGAALAPAGHSSAGALVRDADAAMYRSKSTGKARIEVFRTEMRDPSERRLEVGRLLRNALDDSWVTTHYQPVFRQVDGGWRLHSLETLARCPLPDGTYLSPEHFIPVAEQTGLISRLGDRVRHLAAEDLVRWTADHGDAFQVWVNVSVQELDRDDLAAEVLEHLDREGVAPDRFGIEITESAMAADHPVAMATVAELRSHGVTVVIDDFGTGYSSLSAIKNYPADVVKIDRGFISGILDAPADLAIVRSVVEIGGVIGLEIVAEGVETPEQLRALSAVGCSRAQGFHLARPVPAASVDAHIEGWLRGDLGAGVEV